MRTILASRTGQRCSIVFTQQQSGQILLDLRLKHFQDLDKFDSISISTQIWPCMRSMVILMKWSTLFHNKFTSVFREYLTNPEEYLNTQVSQKHRGIMICHKKQEKSRSGRWATRPATPLTPRWTPRSVQRTAIVWRSTSLPRTARKGVDCTSAVSGGTKPFAMSAGIRLRFQVSDIRYQVQI